MANSTYNKFGRLIRIVGNSSTNAAAAWANYKAEVAKGDSGNIVFADLTFQDGDSSVVNPKGYYLYANGIQYKVADLETFNTRYNEFTQYVTDANASISDLSTDRNELERWRGALNFALSSDAKITIVDGKNVGIKGLIQVTGGEYIDITVPTNSSIINVSIENAMIARSTRAERDSGDYRKLTTKGYVDTSIDVVNSSISNISTRVSALLEEVGVLDITSTAYNDASVGFSKKYEGHHEAPLWREAGQIHFQGDGKYIIAGVNSSGAISYTLGVNDQAIDSVSVGNASLSTTGVIKSYVDRKVANLTGAIRLIGEINSSTAMHTALTGTDASKGNMWVITNEFDFTSNNTAQDPRKVHVENGDQIIITADRPNATTDAKFIVIERNLDGAVTAGERILRNNYVIVGYAASAGTDAQLVQDSGYTLGGNTSAGIAAGNSNKLATEVAVKHYTEARLDDLKITVNSSTPTYLPIEGSYNKTTDTFSVSTGVGNSTFANATSSTTAGKTLADANTYKKAINDREGTLVVAAKDSAVSADSSVIIAMQATYKNTSISIHGGDFVELSNPNNKSLAIDVKSSLLKDAKNRYDGLAIASDVSAKFGKVDTSVNYNENKIDATKLRLGLTNAFEIPWGTDTAAAYGNNSSVIKVIDALNSSVKNASIHLNKRIDDLTIESSDTLNKILVGVTQKKGVISSSTATLKINDVSFTHTVGSGVVEATINGTHIKVGGNTTQWKDKSVSTAIYDISNMIHNVSAGFLKEVYGEAPLAPDANHKAIDEYIAVTCTSTANNSAYIDASVLVTKHPTVSSQGYSPAADTGLATDGYVKDYLHSILEWEALA